MTTYTQDYEGYNVSLSLNTDSLYIKLLNLTTFEIYDLDIDSKIHNNDKVNYENLFNLFKTATKKDDPKITIDINCKGNILLVELDIDNPFVTFNKIFELSKQTEKDINLKELKKEIYNLNIIINNDPNNIRNKINRYKQLQDGKWGTRTIILQELNKILTDSFISKNMIGNYLKIENKMLYNIFLELKSPSPYTSGSINIYNENINCQNLYYPVDYSNIGYTYGGLGFNRIFINTENQCIYINIA